jgi:PIN domain nuclease of toxin-antitoxin system
VRVLLDTCALLWLTADPGKLSGAVRKIIDDPKTIVFLSHVSVWEIHLKYLARKLMLPQPPRIWIQRQLTFWQLMEQPIDLESIQMTSELPTTHRDPFDRLLIAQSKVHQLRIATPDPIFKAYKAATLW